MERERNPSLIFAHPQTHEFLLAAIKDGAIERTISEFREHASENDESFRDLNILAIYYSTAASYQKISDLYSDISLETVRRRINKVLFTLWQNSSEDIRNRFPFESIVTAKPAQNASGESSLTLANIIETSNNDSEIQEAFNKMSFRILLKLTRQEEPLVVSSTQAALLSGYFVRHSEIPQFLESLRASNVPLGHIQRKTGDKILNYYFIASQHLGRIKGIFDNDPNLSRFSQNPVQRAFGPEQDTPTTQELVYGNTYTTPGHLFSELGIKMGRKTFIRYPDFFTDSPVTIFRYTSRLTYFYRAEDEDELRKYIEFRARQLGLLG